ncbi:MAG: hypothetical protein ACK5PP_12425 [Acidimicrobiales bacterium]
MSDGRTAGASETRLRLLAAAAEWFRSPEYGIFNDIMVARVAARAGVSEATARRHFLAGELHEALIGYLLDPTRDLASEWDESILVDYERMVNDSEVRLEVAVQAIMDLTWPANTTDPTYLAQVALWPYVPGNPSIQRAMASLSRSIDEGITRVFASFIAHNSRVVRLREDWITLGDFAVFATLLAEGAAFRARIHSAGDGEGYGFDPSMPGRVLQAVVASMLSFHDSEVHPLTAQYDRLHRERHP